MPPHFSLASSAEMRLGPNAGWVGLKATIRCSKCGPISFGWRGRRRSRTLSASRPQSVGLVLEAIEGLAADAHAPAPLRDVVQLRRQREEAQAVSEEHVIIRH